MESTWLRSRSVWCAPCVAPMRCRRAIRRGRASGQSGVASARWCQRTSPCGRRRRAGLQHPLYSHAAGVTHSLASHEARVAAHRLGMEPPTPVAQGSDGLPTSAHFPTCLPPNTATPPNEAIAQNCCQLDCLRETSVRVCVCRVRTNCGGAA